VKTRTRTFLLLAALLSVLSTLAAAPADARWWETPAWASPSRVSVKAQMVAGLEAAVAAARAVGANDLYSYAAPRPASPSDIDACGPRYRTLHFSFGVACTHLMNDPIAYPAAAAGAPEPVPGPKAAPKCIGNGVNGGRVQILYVHLDNRPNRAATVVPTILNTYVPHIEGRFRSTSKEQGRELGVRWWAPNCKLSVDVVKVPADLGTRELRDQQFTSIAQYLWDAGFQDTNKRYLVWVDEPSLVACGTGSLLPVDVAGPLNPSNGDIVFGVGANKAINAAGIPAGYALVWGQRQCWERDFMSATHELLHTMGAVQNFAPNSNGAGHCTDDVDIMCYPDPLASEQKQVVQSRCQTRVRQLDCGMDDYFAINPPAGSYLSTRWNIATSQWLGDALGVDAVPVVLPRA
jgi:hypothetical protein